MQNVLIPQDSIERQIKQVMRENYASMEKDVYNNCRKKINDDFYDKFVSQTRLQRSQIGDDDLKILLSTLKKSYESSRMLDDAKAIEAQIAKLDVKV